MKGAQSGYILNAPNLQGAYGNIASNIVEAGKYSAMAEAEKIKQEEAEKAQKDQMKKMAIMLAAAAATGGAAALAAPAVAGAGAAGAGAAGAAGAGATGGGFMAGLSTFGQGALGALTGSGAVPAGTGGVAGALGNISGALGSMGMGMAKQSSDPFTSALGSYFAQSQQSNKAASAFESTLKNPEVRQAMYGNMSDDQVQSVIQYANTLGSQQRAQFYQTALPQLSKYAADQRDFNQQMQLQNARLGTQMSLPWVEQAAKNAYFPQQVKGGAVTPAFDPSVLGFGQ